METCQRFAPDRVILERPSALERVFFLLSVGKALRREREQGVEEFLLCLLIDFNLINVKIWAKQACVADKRARGVT